MRINSDLNKQVARLEQLMHRQFGLSRGDLATRVARARRALPRAIKRDLLTVAQAAHLAQNPRIAPQIDQSKVRAAYKRAFHHLHGPDVTAQRKGRWMGPAAALLVNLTLVFVLVTMVLIWRDLV